jgi:hypothetical protein
MTNAQQARLPAGLTVRAISINARGENPMADLHETGNPQCKEQVNSTDLAFVGFVVIITAIAVILTLTKIYLQNPG